MKREKKQEIVLLQDDIQFQQNKYVNDLMIIETRSSSLVQQRVQAFNIAKFCKEIKGNDGLCDNMADAKSIIRNNIKDINDQIEKQIQQHKNNKAIIKQKEKRIATSNYQTKRKENCYHAYHVFIVY